jgi:hypothetical protein
MILIDDFDDGNDDGWTHYVMPDDDAPWGPGIFDASSGEYNLKTTNEVTVGTAGGIVSIWDASADPLYSEGYLRATVRCESGGTNAALWLRAEPAVEGGGAYLFTTTIFGGLIAFDCTDTSCRLLRESQVGFTRGEDWILEVGAVGNLLSAKIWRAGEAEPDKPQLEFRDGTYSTGQFGVDSFIGSNWQQREHASAFFDDIYFTPIPEPSSALLIGLGSVGLAFWRRKKPSAT